MLIIDSNGSSPSGVATIGNSFPTGTGKSVGDFFNRFLATAGAMFFSIRNSQIVVDTAYGVITLIALYIGYWYDSALWFALAFQVGQYLGQYSGWTMDSPIYTNAAITAAASDADSYLTTVVDTYAKLYGLNPNAIVNIFEAGYGVTDGVFDQGDAVPVHTEDIYLAYASKAATQTSIYTKVGEAWTNAEFATAAGVTLVAGEPAAVLTQNYLNPLGNAKVYTQKFTVA